ncbi:ATP-dependent RNA helicase DBP4 [Blastocystis hominis]|uniref:ATP-dependent RNA helicase n=1 Tax=Blastocystis hominis TaxID=12968 RepID=D8M4V3_BLAHO|nr:ATP-dependent RNA helicase DBP4 [Blastocystis hominis]CBK23092.2 ATP-dependent RNA helicase DBP4 [Blastocystis hominis]|eukprot:XP_012897140.1 ATP-dependent RNA helicase DBP4 [Blastocystis hominis]
MAGKKRQFSQKGKNFGKNKKGNRSIGHKKESKIDREIREITQLQKQIEELSALPEEEKANIKKFEALPLSNYTKKGLNEAGFTEMTDIQQKSLISALMGRDILGCAKTGSGKTLAFLIPALECLYRERWTEEDGIGIVIISPTRELAMQIFDVLCTIGKYHSFSAGLVIGGKDFEEEQSRIVSMNILVATPGRFLQHLEQTPGFDCSNVRGLVLDEVDRCLDMGFKTTIDHIVDSLGGDRQTQLFSATIDENVKTLASSILSNPVSINVNSDDDYATPTTLTQRYIVCDLSRKVELLYSFIKSHLRCKILVFAASRKEVRFLFEAFRRMKPGVSLLHLHGKQKQTMRTYTYYDFIQKDHAVLFCTDVAARGIDFPAVDWVVQFDCPEDAATYIHRVGRAGRFRAKGNGLLFLLPQEEAAFLPMMAEANIPLKRIAVNPSRTQSVTNRLMEEIARDETLGQLASKAFQSYVRSVYLASNKQLFDVRALPLEGFAEVGSPIPRLSVVAGAGRGAEPELLEEEGEEGGVLRAAAAPGGDQEGRGGQGARQRALAGRCERCERCERGTESGGGDFGRGRLPAEDGEDDGGRARVGGPAAGEEAEEAAADLAGRRADREEHSVRRERRGDRRHARRGGAEGRGGRDRRGGGEGASERRADAAGRERRKGSDARKEASQGEEDAAQAEGEGDA